MKTTKKACERYQSLFIKEKKEKYGCKKYKNLPENGKQKLVEYRKNIIKWKKMLYYNYKK